MLPWKIPWHLRRLIAKANSEGWLHLYAYVVSKVRSSVGINYAMRKSILLSFCIRPGRLIAVVERHTYFQFPVTYHINQITIRYVTHTLSWRRQGSNLQTFGYKVNALLTELTCRLCREARAIYKGKYLHNIISYICITSIVVFKMSK